MSSNLTRQQRYRTRKDRDSKPLHFYVSQDIHNKIGILRTRSEHLPELKRRETFTLEYFFTTWVNAVIESLQELNNQSLTIQDMAKLTVERVNSNVTNRMWALSEEEEEDDDDPEDTFINIYEQIQLYFPKEFPYSRIELDRFIRSSVIR